MNLPDWVQDQKSQTLSHQEENGPKNWKEQRFQEESVQDHLTHIHWVHDLIMNSKKCKVFSDIQNKFVQTKD